MSQTIILFYTPQLQNAEFVTFMSETDKQIQIATPAHLGIESFYGEFSGLLGSAKLIHRALSGNPLTDVRDEAEGWRDNRYSAFTACVRNAIYDSDPAVSEAAEDIMEVVSAVGRPTNLGMNVQTERMHTLMEQLQPVAAQIEKIGAGQRLQELDEASREFERLQGEWYKAGGEKPKESLAAVRQQMVTVYRSIITRVNSLIDVNGPELYRSFMNTHNETIRQYKNIIAQRKGRGGKKS